jgi:hypothetical protein
VCKVLDELNVDQYDEQAPLKAQTSASTSAAMPSEPQSSIIAAWAILADRTKHLDTDGVTNLLNEMGVEDPTTLLGCPRSVLHNIAGMLKPAPRNVFVKAVKETWEINKAWSILLDEKQVRNKEGLAGILEDQGMDKAEYLADVEEEVLTQIVQCLKPAGAKQFKQAMKLE